MQRQEHPPGASNPYPDGPVRLSGFRYESALSLIRPKGAVQDRPGPDADYILQHDFVVSVEIDGVRQVIRAPAGLITDLTSVPRLLRVFVSRVGPWLEASILHDYLYIAWQAVPDLGPRGIDRLFADRMMLLAMVEARVGWLTRWEIYLAVRLFGARAFREIEAMPYADLESLDLMPSVAARAGA